MKPHAARIPILSSSIKIPLTFQGRRYFFLDADSFLLTCYFLSESNIFYMQFEQPYQSWEKYFPSNLARTPDFKSFVDYTRL